MPIDDVAAASAARRMPFAFVTGYRRESRPEHSKDRSPLISKPFDRTPLVECTAKLSQLGRRSKRAWTA
jgi:hypothetical protein